MAPIRIALVGLGKISADQHIPSIRGNPSFELVGGVSPRSRIEGIKCFAGLAGLFEATDVSAIAVNTPPQIRFRIAREAISAGKHVLLEKPPGATVTEVLELQNRAADRGVSLYTGWHSQHAPAVAPARRWLADRTIRSIALSWREDVRQWHPGQHWIWQPGGLGVFDPGINALSILTRILPEPLVLDRARLAIPGNCHTPVAATLGGRVGDSGTFSGCLDFLQTGQQTWTIEIETTDGHAVLSMGGAELTLAGKRVDVGVSDEYASIYRAFATLIEQGASEVDVAPLALVSDAFLIAEQVRVEDFVE